jgi:hypothetical protein
MRGAVGLLPHMQTWSAAIITAPTFPLRTHLQQQATTTTEVKPSNIRVVHEMRGGK